jgi:hypothetical protein
VCLLLTAAMLTFAANKGMSADTTDDQFQRFVNYHLTNAKLSANWEASWRTWVSNHFKFKQRDAQKAAAERSTGRGSEWEGIV